MFEFAPEVSHAETQVTREYPTDEEKREIVAAILSERGRSRQSVELREDGVEDHHQHAAQIVADEVETITAGVEEAACDEGSEFNQASPLSSLLTTKPKCVVRRGGTLIQIHFSPSPKIRF